MGSFALSAQGGGTVTLVAPTRLRIDGLGLQGRTLSVTTLKLTFVPEPGTLLLLAVAGAALALGAARTRRQRATKS